MGILLLLLFLFGCAPKVKEGEEAQLSKSAPLEKTLCNALAQDAFEKGELKESWWEMFYDPQLTELIETALKENPTLMSAQAKIKEAKALAAELALLDQAFHECQQGRGEPLTDIINEPDDE